MNTHVYLKRSQTSWYVETKPRGFQVQYQVIISQGGLLQFFRDSVARTTIACQTSVFTVAMTTSAFEKH